MGSKVLTTQPVTSIPKAVYDRYASGDLPWGPVYFPSFFVGFLLLWRYELIRMVYI